MSPTHLDYLRETLAPLFERYTAFGPVVLNAAHFGVPQNRRRMVVIGMRGVAVAVPGSGITKRRKAGEVLTAEPKGAPNPSKIVYAKTPDLRPDPSTGQLFNGGGRPIDLERPAPTILASAGGNKTHFLDLGRRVPPYHKHLMDGGEPRKGELSKRAAPNCSGIRGASNLPSGHGVPRCQELAIQPTRERRAAKIRGRAWRLRSGRARGYAASPHRLSRST